MSSITPPPSAGSGGSGGSGAGGGSGSPARVRRVVSGTIPPGETLEVPAPESGPIPRPSRISLAGCLGLPELVTRLDAAVVAGGACAKLTTATVKGVLEDLLQKKSLVLPQAFFEACPDAYARRLLHRDPAGRYTAIVMCWGAGQQTPIHDHNNMWCVEGVVLGRIFFTNYVVEPLPGAGEGAFSATPLCTNWAGEGAAGCLIPPTDHHVLGNALPTTSVTLHVYGGEMKETHVYLPELATGAYKEHVRALRYTEEAALPA